MAQHQVCGIFVDGRATLRYRGADARARATRQAAVDRAWYPRKKIEVVCKYPEPHRRRRR